MCSVLQLLSNTHVDILPVYAVLALSSLLSAYIVPVGPPFIDTHLVRHQVLQYLPPLVLVQHVQPLLYIRTRFEAVQVLPTRRN